MSRDWRAEKEKRRAIQRERRQRAWEERVNLWRVLRATRNDAESSEAIDAQARWDELIELWEHEYGSGAGWSLVSQQEAYDQGCNDTEAQVRVELMALRVSAGRRAVTRLMLNGRHEEAERVAAVVREAEEALRALDISQDSIDDLAAKLLLDRFFSIV